MFIAAASTYLGRSAAELTERRDEDDIAIHSHVEPRTSLSLDGWRPIQISVCDLAAEFSQLLPDRSARRFSGAGVSIRSDTIPTLTDLDPGAEDGRKECESD